MRLVYLDEAGTSAHEPHLVVCGVMIDADRLLIAVEDYLDSLADKYVHAHQRDGFVFHATDIWSGSGIYKDAYIWPAQTRFDMLEALAATPAKFDLPVSLGWVDKARFEVAPKQDGYSKEQIANTAHAVAFAECAQGIEFMMREIGNDEIALLIGEDVGHMRAILKEAHQICRDPKLAAPHQIDELPLYPYRKIRDTIHFAKKPESRPLQLADVCACIVRAHLIKNRHAPRYYDVLKPQLLYHPTPRA